MTIHAILSGGLDSTAALAWSLSHYPSEPHQAVSFDYNQRHARELRAAAAIAAWYEVPHTILDIRGLLSGSSLLGDGDVPEGHYADDTMAATVVNGRNLLFAAATIARTQPHDAILVGVHAGDHPIYPDCRPGFWQGVTEAAAAYEVGVMTPWVLASKAEVVKAAAALGAPLELTWSCYQGGSAHCGRCGTCVERAEAFAEAQVPDPTAYIDPGYWREVTTA